MIGVNISAIQLEDATFAECITHALREFGVDPKAVESEITESVVVGGQDDLFSKPNGLGQRLAIDDFGTG